MSSSGNGERVNECASLPRSTSQPFA
ncbi:hypothetical protein E2C01_056285 [Portunus trituberculatus]|uniref:Uncharacterized protein n=1 Tax=Portunus trituberculatus TaxID=210409 RepID=A0A5B7GTP3_PORTR|nr:hypothetical protein [Portunus trituberculatus]